MIPSLKLSTLAIVLGLACAAPQIYALMKPAAYRESMRKFPRSLPWGYFLVGLGTIWFLLNLNQESIADFARFKPVMLAAFGLLGLLTCIFVQDFLAVRGLAIVLMLLAKLMVDTGRPLLGETPWVLLIQSAAYVFVVAGIWFTVSPWRLRDLLNWSTASDRRIRTGSGIRLALGVLITILGLTAIKAAEQKSEAARSGKPTGSLRVPAAALRV